MQQANAVGEELLQRSPNDLQTMMRMMQLEKYNGDAYQKLKNRNDAVAHYTRAATIGEQVLQRSPDNKPIRVGLDEVKQLIAATSPAQ